MLVWKYLFLCSELKQDFNLLAVVRMPGIHTSLNIDFFTVPSQWPRKARIEIQFPKCVDLAFLLPQSCRAIFWPTQEHWERSISSPWHLLTCQHPCYEITSLLHGQYYTVFWTGSYSLCQYFVTVCVCRWWQPFTLMFYGNDRRCVLTWSL